MADPRSDLHLRRYQAGDHDAVWALHNVALDQVGAHGGNGSWDDDLHSIEEVYLAGDGEFLVGLQDAELVAMGALRRTGPHEATLTRMRVAPHRQGRGLGSELLEALERRARELGISRLRLNTTTRQHVAQALYRSRGFQLSGTGREAGFEVVFFEKQLDAGGPLDG